MSHEQSETITRPSGAYNVYGGTQYPLSPIFGFEKPVYPSIDEAVNAAQWRSRMGGGPEGGQSPSYGFQPQPQPEYIGFLNKLLNTLADPRNAWMGTGLIGGTVKGVGGLRSFFEHRQPFQDPGGFAVPLEKMTKDIPLLKSEPMRGAEGLQGTTMPGPYHSYIDRITDANSMAKTLSGRQGNLLEQLQMRDAVNEMHPSIQGEIEGADKGQRALDQLNRQARTHEEGPPPEFVRRLFGFER